MKSIEEFASYIHSKNGNLYTRHICLECFRKQNNKYKQSIKSRVCLQCGEEKEGKYFPRYKSIPIHYKQSNVCLRCTAENSRIKHGNRRKEKGEVVPDKPNTYTSTEQKELAFELMTSIGFTFNEETGRWSKEGFKNEDGTFVRIEERKRLILEKKQKETEDMNIWQRITYLRNGGSSINDIVKLTGLNYTAVHKFIKYSKETNFEYGKKI
jgi:hypothetical protein